jgi:hypothetical protein
LDIAKIQDGNIKEVDFQFGKTIAKTNILESGSFVKIWDIKTKGMLSYYKTLTDCRKGKIPFHWNGQFHVYMQSTGLKELTVLLKDRDMGSEDSFVVHWDDRVWDWVVQHEVRIEDLTEQFKTHKPEEVMITAEDLEYLAKNPLSESEDEEDTEYPKCWKSCPLSVTKQTEDKNGTPKLELIKPCNMVCGVLKPIALAKFQVGQMWERGSSDITILEINPVTEIIQVVNKGKKVYEDTIFYALDSYNPMGTRPPRVKGSN